jgi:hypothetical protein
MNHISQNKLHCSLSSSPVSLQLYECTHLAESFVTDTNRTNCSFGSVFVRTWGEFYLDKFVICSCVLFRKKEFRKPDAGFIIVTSIIISKWCDQFWSTRYCRPIVNFVQPLLFWFNWKRFKGHIIWGIIQTCLYLLSLLMFIDNNWYKQTNKLGGFSPPANYTEWATAACRRN